LPSEIAELQAYGITRIYAPDDGRSMGLQGMINDLVQQSDFPTGDKLTDEVAQLASKIQLQLPELYRQQRTSPIAKPALEKRFKKTKTVKPSFRYYRNRWFR
jgi:methylmalonyl-CoA mutase